MKKKKSKSIWVLSVDFEGGDGADYFPIRDGNEKDLENIRKHAAEMLFLSVPPPKVELKLLTPIQWRKALKAGRDR